MPASASRPKCQAVEGRLERRVRPRCLSARECPQEDAAQKCHNQRDDGPRSSGHGQLCRRSPLRRIAELAPLYANLVVVGSACRCR